MATYIMLIFWLSLACIFYTYIGYPAVLWFCMIFSRRQVHKGSFEPKISIVISAWNEAANIARRLDNILAQDYPAAKVEVIVVSDGSTDSTSAIVTTYHDKNVRLVELDKRVGKSLALNEGVAWATGEIIIFTDARQHFKADAISQLVANFNDPMVGCVSGELIFLQDNVSLIQAEMGAYWNYEKWIRRMESRSGSVIGATGAIYAIRKEIYKPLPADTILDDVLTPLSIVRQGYRCIFESDAVAFDNFSKDAGEEWHRKVRTLAGNWQLLSLCPELFLPVKNPSWWRFVSHKIMRLIVPFALISLFFSGCQLPGVFCRTATVLQILVYAAALASVFAPILRSNRIASLGYFFLVMNAAALSGFYCWVTGRSSTVWKSSVKQQA